MKIWNKRNYGIFKAMFINLSQNQQLRWDMIIIIKNKQIRKYSNG